MGKLNSQTTFNGDVYSVLSIQGKRQEGIGSKRTIHINEAKTKIVIVSSDEDVLAVISSESGSPLNIEILS